MAENQTFHVGLKAFIGKGKRLLIMREGTNFAGGGRWELPGGRIEEGESGVPLEEILLREIREECGKKLRVKVGEVVSVWRRPHHPEHHILLVGFNCRWLAGEVKLSDEHIDCAWVTKSDMPKYHFVEGYREVIKEYFETIK